MTGRGDPAPARSFEAAASPHIWDPHFLALRPRWMLLQKAIDLLEDGSGRVALDLGSGYRSVRSLLTTRCITTDIVADVRPDVVCDNAALPFKDDCFDLIVASETLEHTRAVRDAGREIVRVARRGGYVFASLPFAYPVHGAPGDFHRLTEFALQELFPGAEVVELRASNTIFSMWILAFQYALELTLRALPRGTRPLIALVAVPTNLIALVIDGVARRVVTALPWSVRSRLDARAGHPRGLVGALESMPAGYAILLRKPWHRA